MVQLIIWGVMIAGLLAAVWAGVAHVEGIGGAKQLAKDSAAISACQTNEKTLTDANQQLQQSVGVIAAERDSQNTAVGLWQKAAENAATEATLYKGKFLAQDAAAQKWQYQAHTQSLRPADSSLTCQQVLSEIYADARVWIPEREARMRAILGLEPLPTPAPKAAPKLRISK